MTKGTCRLCLNADAELQGSHIMPRFSYVRVRGDGPQPDPVHIRSGRAFQSQAQVTEPLLCWDCEQRFQKVESRVAALVPLRDGRPAPILALLGGVFEATEKGTRAVDLGKVSASDLGYFGASVLWRGHVSRSFPVQLGPTYAEHFRRYLLDEAPFPTEAACVVTFYDLSFGDEVDLAATCVGVETYRRAKGVRSRSHGFMVMGLQFFFQVGNQLERWAVASCTVRNRTMFLARQEQLVSWLAPAILGARTDSRLSARLDRT